MWLRSAGGIDTKSDNEKPLTEALLVEVDLPDEQAELVDGPACRL
jgi:hypothetical protein